MYTKASLHPNEEQRINSLKQLDILDTAPEKEYDDLTFLASQIFQAPMALVSLIDTNRQWFKSNVGMDATETVRDIAFCAHAILQKKTLIIPNAAEDPRFAGNILVTGKPHIRFYAGTPILSPDGLPMGTICVIDTKPREYNETHVKCLEAIASQVGALLLLRKQIKQLKIAHNNHLINRKALENISEGFVLQDRQDKIIEFNSSACSVLGLTEDQLLGKSSMDPLWKSIKEDGSAFLPEDHPSVVCIKTGQPQKNVIMGIQIASSTPKWIKINSNPLYLDDNSSPSHTVTVFADITKEINFQKDLINKKNELRFLIDSIPHMIGYFDKNLLNISSNLQFANQFSSSTQNIKKSHLKDIVGENLFQSYKPHIETVLEGKSISFESEISVENQSPKNVYITFLPNVESNKVESFILIIMDITKIKTLENERRHLEARLVESARLSTLGEIAGGLAHEINNPLTIIRGTASSAKRKLKSFQLDPNEQIYTLEKIENTVDRIAKIIRGLKSYSRDAENDPMEKVSLLQTLNETLEMCGEKLKIANIDLQIKSDEDIFVMGRAAQISQIFMNLINNSYDAVYNLPEKWIRIEIKKQDSKAVVVIADSGSGINTEIAKKIMMPFFTTKEVGKGTGLGLSIAQGISQNHGGQLFYEPALNNTTFKVELPILQNA